MTKTHILILGWLLLLTGCSSCLEPAQTRNVGEIRGAHTVGQTFVTQHDGLEAVDVLLATFARGNTHPVTFHYLLIETVTFPVSTQFLSRFPLATMSTIAVLVFACVLCLILARDRISRDRLVWFGALWMVLGLAPVTLIVAERTTYLSSVGWALASAATIILAWDVAAQRSASLARWLVVLALVLFLGANLVTLTHRSYWRDRAAGISENFFSKVRTAVQELPPGKDNQLWLFNVPDHVEYSDAFGNRILFAVWLLQDQWGVGKVNVLLFQDDNASPQEWAAQLLSRQTRAQSRRSIGNMIA